MKKIYEMVIRESDYIAKDIAMQVQVIEAMEKELLEKKLSLQKKNESLNEMKAFLRDHKVASQYDPYAR